MFTRIHWRIAASYTALVAAVLLVLGIYLVGYLRAQQFDALQAELGREAHLVARNAQDQLTTEGPGGMDPLAKQLGQQIGARVTLIAVDGTVLGDSQHDPATMDNHGTRPEVLDALRIGSGQTERRSATLEEDMLYVAVPMTGDGSPIGVARVALPVQGTSEATNRVTEAVVGALGVGAVLATALAIILARLTAGRVHALTRAAQRMTRGQLVQPVVIEGRDEVAQLGRAFNVMAVRLRTHILAVEDERSRLAALLTHMADGAVILDADNLVSLINPAAARLLEATPETAIGRTAMAVLRDHELAALVAEARTTGVARLLTEVGPAGRRRAIQAVASTVPGGTEVGQRVLLMLQDVTELRRTELIRRDFVANVSHELRTPVAALKTLVETLEDGALQAEDVARDFLGRMHVEVDGLAQLVEELLELARIESGRAALRVEAIDLGRVVTSAAERLRPLAERQGIGLVVDSTNSLPAVQADPERIQQVVANLVHNAVKFTPPGGRVSVTVERQGDSIAVAVTDTGAGIAPEALGRLFERFYRTPTGRAGPGTGLGLAIAKHIVQAHGGRIWAESAGEGRGARFTFELPLAPASTGL